MGNYDAGKLKRSLILKIRDQLANLMPESDFTERDGAIDVKHGELEGTVQIDALVQLCLNEERSNWGLIAGEFCNLVMSRVMASMAPLVDGTSQMNDVVPAVVPIQSDYDQMIVEATPTDGLQVVGQDWLPGLRIEFDYRSAAMSRRLFNRDLAALGFELDQLMALAVDNLRKCLSDVEIKPIGTGEVTQRILCARGEGIAPALLLSAPAHSSMFEQLSEIAGSSVPKVVAIAPRTDLVVFCDVRDRSAASLMVSTAWASIEADTPDGIPLSPRLFSISGPGEVAFFDVGLSAEKTSDWTEHKIATVILRAPERGQLETAGDHWKLAPEGGGPELKLSCSLDGAGSPIAARRAAEKRKADSGSSVEITHGFFNGLPWARAELGKQDGANRAAMYVVTPFGMYSLDTCVPDGSPPPAMLELQKILSTLQLVTK